MPQHRFRNCFDIFAVFIGKQFFQLVNDIILDKDHCTRFRVKIGGCLVTAQLECCFKIDMVDFEFLHEALSITSNG